jgi:hypothetical protein
VPKGSSPRRTTSGALSQEGRVLKPQRKELRAGTEYR